jgi:hypothetical protein
LAEAGFARRGQSAGREENPARVSIEKFLRYNFHMSDQPKPPVPGSQLQIELDETTAQGAYCNLVFLNHNDAEFTFDFVYVQPGGPRARVRSRIIISPRHAKRFLRAIESNIARYEQVFGKIDEGAPVDPSRVS